VRKADECHQEKESCGNGKAASVAEVFWRKWVSDVDSYGLLRLTEYGSVGFGRGRKGKRSLRD